MNEASKLLVPCSNMTCLNALGVLSEKRVCTNQTWRGKPPHWTYEWRREIREKPSQRSLYIKTPTEAGRLIDTATSQQNITESIRLEKASEIIESNLWQNITASTRPWHWVPHPAFLRTPQGRRLRHLPALSVPVSNHPFYKEILPNTQTKPPLAQLETVSSCPVRIQFFPFGHGRYGNTLVSELPQRSLCVWWSRPQTILGLVFSLDFRLIDFRF